MRFPVARLALIVLTVVWAGCQSSAPTMAPTENEAPREEAAATPAPAELERPIPYPVEYPLDFQRALASDTRSTDGTPGADYWQQDASYQMTARLHPETKRLEGTSTITYANNAPEALNVLVLELAQNLHMEGAPRNEAAEVTGGVEIQRVAVNGQALETGRAQGPRYVEQGTLLGLVLGTPMASSATATIEIDWAFTIPQAGAGARMGYSEDNLFFLAYWYPQMAVYDDVVGWNTEFFLGQAEFYADFSDYDVTIEAPEGWIVWATGDLQNPDEVLDAAVVQRMRQAHASDEPMTVVPAAEAADATAEAGPDSLLRWRFTASEVRDFAFSATRASTWDAARTPVGDLDGDGAIDYTAINTFWRTEAPLWSEVTAYQQHAIAFLSEYTGFPYPWPHMTAVEGAGIIGGGMEFPMMTLMGDYNSRGDSALYNVTAHELAHMWIPMIASPNERRYSWIDEGSTTFAENQARADIFPGIDHGVTDQEIYLNVARNDLEGEIMRRSNYHYPGPGFGIASYQKPATLLRALRGLLGEDTFHTAYQSFIETWAYKHPYPYDFFNTFERVSGQDLDWFWSSWYYTTWTLDHSLASVERTGEETAITVVDEGKAPMPVRLTITLENGETLQREIPVETWLSGADEATVTIETASPVARVEIDPERAFPDIDRSDNVWTP